MKSEQTWPLKPSFGELLPVYLASVLFEVYETQCMCSCQSVPMPSDKSHSLHQSIFYPLKGLNLHLNLVFQLLIIEAIREQLYLAVGI